MPKPDEDQLIHVRVSDSRGVVCLDLWSPPGKPYIEELPGRLTLEVNPEAVPPILFN